MAALETHRQDIDERVEDLLRSPLGCAFLAIIEESNLPASDVSAPDISLQVAAKAVRVVHTYETRSLNAANCLRSDSLKDLALAILNNKKADWWFEALQRHQQAWIQFPEKNRSLSHREFVPVAASGPSSTASRKMGKPIGSGLYTSTIMENVSSWQASLNLECDAQRDKDFGIPPYHQWRLSADSSSRIYEITRPSD